MNSLFAPYRSNTVSVAYAVTAVLGFLLPMICFGYHFGNDPGSDAWTRFFTAPWLTWATAGFSWDLMMTATTLMIWISVESSRLSMKGLYWNLALVFLVGMSFALPVFLLRRESKLNRRLQSES